MSNEALLRIYYFMRLTRAMEDRTRTLFLQGKIVGGVYTAWVPTPAQKTIDLQQSFVAHMPPSACRERARWAMVWEVLRTLFAPSPGRYAASFAGLGFLPRNGLTT